MSGEKYYEHCDVDPIAFGRDLIEISIRENENVRADAYAQLTNAADNFNKANAEYENNATSKNKKSRSQAKLRLTIARKHFREADYSCLNAQRKLKQYEQENNIKKTQSVSEETLDALIMLELTKGEYDKAHAEYEKALAEHPDLAQAKKECDEAKTELDAARDKYDKASKKWNGLKMQFRKEHDVLADTEMNAFEALLKALENIKNIKNKIIGDRI